MTVLKEGVVGGALNLYFIYKFLRILTTPFASTEAFKLGIIDEKGKILKKKSKLKTIEEKEAYTMMHRLVWKLKRLMEKIPFGKSRLASYAAALWLIKEENEFDGTDQELQESFLSFLETDWENDALILKENYEGDTDKKTFSNLREGHKKGHKLPPHLAKFFDKKGNLKKDAADRVRKGRKQRGVKITDRTPDWMFPEEAPPGWEGTIKAMKKKKNIDNPYALAWYMHNKGMKPHVPEEVNMKIIDEKKSDYEKEIAAFKEKGGKVKKLKPGKTFKSLFGKGYKPKKLPRQAEDIKNEENLKLDEIVKTKDKSVIDSFYDEKPLEGRMLSTDGKTLDKIGIGAQQIAKWNNGKITVTAKTDSKSTESILKYLRNNVPEKMFAEELSIEEKYVIKHIKNKNRYLSNKAMDASNVKDALKFKSEKEAKNTLNGLDWQFRSNYEIVKEGYEKETSLWLDKAFSGLDYQWKDGALIVPKGWRGKVARRMKGDGIKPPIKGIKEEVELNEMKWVVGGVYHQEFENGDRVYFRADSVQKNKRWKGMSVDEFDGRQKKAKNASADEKLPFWKVTPEKDIPKALKEECEFRLEEKAKYDLYHKTYSGAVQHAADVAKKQGYEVDQDSWDSEISSGQRKPSAGKTVSKKVKLIKGGKEQRKQLHIQIYGMDSGKYELNMYIEELKTGKTFKNFITEGRPVLDPDYVPPRTETDAMKAKLLSTQKRLYSAKDIESLARKYKVKLDGPPVGGKSWNGDWEIALKNGVSLSYEYGPNSTYIKGWKFDRKAIKSYIEKYGNHSDTPRDYAPMGGKVLVGGLEAAFEVITEEVELNERKYNWAVIDTADKNRVQALTSDEKGARDSVKSSTTSKYDYHYGKDPKTLKVVKLKKTHTDNDIGDPLKEEAPANSVASGNVNLDPFKKKKRKNAKVQTETFAGQKVFVVTPERFYDSRLGKSRYVRYEKYVGNDKLGEAIRQYGRENPKAAIILKNSGNGAMLYLKYGRK